MPKSITPIEGWPTGIRAAFTTRALGCELVQPVLAGSAERTVDTDPNPRRTDFDGFNLGSHVGDDPARVLAHRQALEQAIGAKPVWLNQVHGAEVLQLDGSDASIGQDGSAALGSHLPSVDAFITNQPNTAACIMAADCLPVLAATANGQWVGAAHAGWRGLAAGVLENLLGSMMEAQAQAQAEDRSLMVWLGPCIGPQAFEVGPEVLKAFELEPLDALVRPSYRPQHFYLDLAGLAARRLSQWAQQYQVALDLKTEDQACTWSEPLRYYSHRRAAPCGRMAFLIWREG